MSKLEQLKEKAKGLEAKDPKKAVEIWLEVLNNQDEANPDLSVYNRIGDLYIKLRIRARRRTITTRRSTSTPSSAFTTTRSRCATRCCATLPRGRRPIS